MLYSAAVLSALVLGSFGLLIIYDWIAEERRRRRERAEYRAEPRCWACGRPDPEGECMGCALDLLDVREEPDEAETWTPADTPALPAPSGDRVTV